MPDDVGLTPEHCADVPGELGEDVVLTLTDYSPEPQKDRDLLDLLKKVVSADLFLAARIGDCACWRASPGPAKSKSCRRACKPSTICWPTVRSRWTTLARGCTAEIGVAARDKDIDNRRRPSGKGQAVYFTIARENPLHAAGRPEALSASPLICDIHIPLDNIRRWRDQFARRLEAPKLFEHDFA